MPVPPSYADSVQRASFVQWLNQKLAASCVSKTKVAGALGHDTTQQLNKFLRGEALPMPLTLRMICREIGASWLEAFALAGYYQDILEVLAVLAELGRRWLTEDNAFRDEAAAQSFRSVGATRLDGKIVWEALKERRYAARYTLAYWEEGPFEPRPASDYEGLDPHLVAMMKADDERESREPRKVFCVVPKPLAVAILVAAVGFPRRGDIYKDEASTYAANLLSATTPLVDTAEAAINKRRTLPPLLRRADGVLKDRFLPSTSKRVIAAEYVVAWADRECSRYTHIARLGAFDYFGEAGSSMKTLTAFVQLPQIRRVELPDPAEFSKIVEEVKPQEGAPDPL